MLWILLLDKQFNKNVTIYMAAELFSRLIIFCAIPVYAYLLNPDQIANYYIYIPLASIFIVPISASPLSTVTSVELEVNPIKLISATPAEIVQTL